MAKVMYSVLRYIESAVRFEPRNVGVVAMDLESGSTDIRFVDRMPVLNPAHRDLVATASAALQDDYNRFLLFCEGAPEEKTFVAVVNQVHGVLDATEPRYYETDMPFNAEFEKLFRIFASRGSRPARRDVTKRTMVRTTDQVLARFGLLGKAVEKGPKVASKLTPSIELAPDYKWVNGRDNYVLLRPFGGLSRPEKIEDLARSTAYMAEELADDRAGVKVFYTPPADTSLADVVREIMATRADPAMFTEDHLAEFARRVQASVH